jgi:polysaccharide pyruvyl transferase CsaB
LKILMVLMGLNIGGAETHVLELSKELARRKREITVVSSGGVYAAELEEAGIKHVCLPTDSRRIDKMLKSYIGLYKLIKREKFDIVHAHARIPAFLCGLIRKRLVFKFITTAHWVFKTGPLLNAMTNWGERTIAVSDDIKKYLKDNYSVIENHVTVTINGIDTDKFSPHNKAEHAMQQLGLKTSAKRAVYVSRIDTDRSAVAFLLVNIMPRICKRYPDFELVIVGGGNDFERLSQAAQECNKKLKRAGVILTGPRVDINNYIACADIFVGVSRAALEAMSSAKPVIVAGNEGYIGLFDSSKLDVGIETNFCCRGCAPATEEKLFSDLVSVMDRTPSERTSMGEYNRKIVIDLYSVKKMADDCEAAYADLLSIDQKRPYDIMISGYYGYKNTGDDSLLYAIVKNLTEEKKHIDITVLSANPAETSKLYGVRSINRFNALKVLRYMRRTKLLISGGGSLLQDVTSTKSLLYYLSVIKAAKRAGMKVMVYASGIGPIKNKNNRGVTRDILNEVDLITLREPASFDELKLLNVEKPPIYVTTDPAFSLEKASDSIINEILEKEGIDKNSEYFIVSIRPWKNIDKAFNTKLATLCDFLSDKYNMTALFVPMQCSADIDANYLVAKNLKSRYSMIKGSYSAQQLLGIISKAKLVIGMRLHVLIYAASALVPFFGISYDTKVDSMLSYLGQYYKEGAENIDVERMKKGIDEIMSKYHDIKDKIKDKTDLMRENTKIDSKYAARLLKNSAHKEQTQK